MHLMHGTDGRLTDSHITLEIASDGEMTRLSWQLNDFVIESLS